MGQHNAKLMIFQFNVPLKKAVEDVKYLKDKKKNRRKNSRIKKIKNNSYFWY